MSLVAMVPEVFAPGGVLARADGHFQPRDGQTQMAVAVAETIAEGGALVVEAGTGVGKTYAYLVPALLSGERVLLSTATKALQDQLFARDLPRLAQILGQPVRMALLKGRASYLCLHRMQQARLDVQAQDRGAARVLAKVEDWSRQTVSGDLAELTGLDERSPVIPLVTSTRENCLGSSCPRFRDCHVHRARREALTMAVLTQTRVAVTRYELLRHELGLWNQAFADERTMLQKLQATQEAGLETELELMRAAARLAITETNRDVVHANLEHAAGRVMHSVGFDLVDAQSDARDDAALAAQLTRALGGFERAHFAQVEPLPPGTVKLMRSVWESFASPRDGSSIPRLSPEPSPVFGSSAILASPELITPKVPPAVGKPASGLSPTPA